MSGEPDHPAAPLQLKILHVTQTAKGGVGSYLEEILPLQAKRHGTSSIRVVLPKEHADAFPGLPEECLLPFADAGTGRMASSLRMAAHAVRAVCRWKPDIVHLHSTFAGLVMRPLIPFLPGAPKVVYCPHGWSFDRRRLHPWVASMMAAVERVLSRLCAVVVCVSHYEARRAAAVGIRSNRMKVVANGMADIAPVTAPATRCDTAACWPNDDRLRVLYVGRLDYQKGVDVLVAAMKLLSERAFAIVVGTRVVADCQPEPSASENLRLVGWLDRKSITPLYATADVLVVPSRSEAFGLVAVEGMRAGLPVIASRVGGLCEIVVDGETGRLVEPDDPRGLAAAIVSMDQAQRKAMGARGRDRFLRFFRIERVVQELEHVYEGACASRGTRHRTQQQPSRSDL